MNAMDYDDESEHDLISMDMLENIRDYQREAHYKRRDRIKQRQSECKGALKATRNMGNGIHKVFKTVIKDILQDFPPLGESCQKFPISFQNLETFLK